MTNTFLGRSLARPIFLCSVRGGCCSNAMTNTFLGRSLERLDNARPRSGFPRSRLELGHWEPSGEDPEHVFGQKFGETNPSGSLRALTHVRPTPLASGIKITGPGEAVWTRELPYLND